MLNIHTHESHSNTERAQYNTVRKLKKKKQKKQTPPFGMFGMASRNVSLYYVEI